MTGIDIVGGTSFSLLVLNYFIFAEIGIFSSIVLFFIWFSFSGFFPTPTYSFHPSKLLLMLLGSKWSPHFSPSELSMLCRQMRLSLKNEAQQDSRFVADSFVWSNLLEVQISLVWRWCCVSSLLYANGERPRGPQWCCGEPHQCVVE